MIVIFITKTIKIELTDKEKLIFSCSDGDPIRRSDQMGLDVNITNQRRHSLLWLTCYRNQISDCQLTLRWISTKKIKMSQKQALHASWMDHILFESHLLGGRKGVNWDDDFLRMKMPFLKVWLFFFFFFLYFTFGIQLISECFLCFFWGCFDICSKSYTISVFFFF